MHPAHLFVQSEVAREHDTAFLAKASGLRMTQIDAKTSCDTLVALDEELIAAEERPIVFCSLQMAALIRGRTKRLRAGVDLPDGFLRHSCYSSELPQDWLLNPKGFYLPWGQIPGKIDMISALCGKRVFLRPDSSLKPFPGFDVALGGLIEEHRLRSATDHVYPDELCFLAPARDIPVHEYRCWIVDNEVITSARYSWDAHEMARASEGAATPDAILTRAAELALRLSLREQCFTADFVLIDEQPLLVELNALSTSGWYPGADILSVFRAADRMFV